MTAVQHVAIGLGLVVLFAVAYAPVHRAGFVYEDALNRRAVKVMTCCAFGALPRTLTRLTWWAQQRWTPRPFAFHVLNLLLHLLATALVGLLALRLGFSPTAAWAAVIVFLLHKMQVESVAYVTGRADLMAAIGVLWACVLAAGDWWRPSTVVGIGAALLVGLLAKESAVVGLALVPLTVWLQGSWSAAPRAAKRSGLAVACAGVVALIALLVDGRILTIGDTPSASIAWRSWVLAQATAAGQLLTFVAWPNHLTVDLDIDAVPMAARIASAVALTALAWQAWALRRRCPQLAFAIAWVLICLLPRLLIRTPRSYYNAHQFYLSMVGCALAIGSTVDWRRQGESV